MSQHWDRPSYSDVSIPVSLSNAVDHGIVHEILWRARSEHTLVGVQDAYNSVLREHGIRPEEDEDYYHFLLRLQHIPGTWGERAAAWRAQESSLRGPEPEQDIERRGGPSRPRVQQQKQVRRMHPTRARLPFLASASSDLDDAYGSDGDADADDSESATSHVVPTRTSPRRSMVRSLVGYTPSATDSEPEYGADRGGRHRQLPIRTSTPVHVQGSGYFADMWRVAGSGATPPSSEAETETETQSAGSRFDADLTLTPPRRFTSLQQDLPPPPPRTLDIPHIDPRVQRELEAVADQFFDNGPQGALGLQAKCWAVWRGSAVWIRQASADMDSIYDTVLKKRTFDKMVDAAGRLIATRNLADEHYARRRKQAVVDRWATMTRLNALEREFVATRRNSAVRKALNTWRTRFLAACAQRWEASMNAREDELRRAFDNKRVQRAFDHWYGVTQERKADKHLVSTTLHKVFSTWSQRASQSEQLKHKLRLWEKSKTATTVRNAFRHWSLRSAEQRFVRSQDTRLVARTLSQWRHEVQQRRLADTFNDARVLRGALGRIQTVLHKTQVRERQADAFAAERDGVLVRQCLRIWVAREHGQLLATALAKRRLRALFSHWRSRTAAVGTLESRVAGFEAQMDARRLHDGLSRWRDALGRRRNSALKADLLFASSTKGAAFAKWKAQSAEQAHNAVVADKAYAFFVLKDAFKMWRRALMRKRRGMLIAQRQQSTLKTAFDTWRTALDQSRSDNARIEHVVALHNGRLLKDTFSRWMVRVVALKERELRIADERRQAVVADAFARWRTAYQSKASLYSMANKFQVAAADDALRSAFTKWSRMTRKSIFLRERLAEFELSRKERVFSLWYERKRERDLAPLEEEAQLKHEDALLFAVFDKWTDSSLQLQAVRFDKARLTRAALGRWKKALKRQRKIKVLDARYDRQILSDAFAAWRAAYMVKIASRPVRRPRQRLSHASDRSTTPPSHAYRPGMGSESPPARDHNRVTSGTSAASEPAYSRLRSEVGRRRVESKSESESEDEEQQGRRATTMRALVQALRNTQ